MNQENTGAATIPDWFTRVVSRVSASEDKTDSLHLIRDGNGLSYGIIQLTQRSGSLYKPLGSTHATDPAKFARAFGPRAATLLGVTRRKTIDPVGGARLWEEPWVSRFKLRVGIPRSSPCSGRSRPAATTSRLPRRCPAS